MSRKFAVFDIDGTVIRWQLYHAIVSQLAAENFLSQDAETRIKNAQNIWKQRTHRQSFREYEHELVHVYLEAISNVPPAEYERIVDTVFDEYKDQVYVYTRDLIRDLKAQGYLLFAISGSHQEIINKMATYYGFDDAVGAVFAQENGRFTGEMQTPIGRKDVVLDELIAKHGASRTDSIAVGDSGGDAAMLEVVARPLAFNPDRDLFEIAVQKGWRIVVERKNMSYELEPNNGTYVLAQTDR